MTIDVTLINERRDDDELVFIHLFFPVEYFPFFQSLHSAGFTNNCIDCISTSSALLLTVLRSFYSILILFLLTAPLRDLTAVFHSPVLFFPVLVRSEKSKSLEDI